MSLAPPPEPRPAFDSGGVVPSEYDVFCEGCGYSLVGIVGDRCPECGRTYDANDLPFARIPWLYRMRLGRWRAYWATVRMILYHPRRFARELCRPVRISAADAKLFRRITLRIALLSFLTTIIAIYAILAWDQLRLHVVAQVFAGLGLALYGIAMAVLLTLGTDMPVFIWRGLPSRPPSELAPIHHYSAAPLALAPVVGVMTVVAVCAGRYAAAADEWPVVYAFCAVAGGLLLTMVGLLWAVPVILMRAATGCSARRVWALILYLPVHWFFMFAMVTMAGILLAMMAERLLRLIYF